MKAVLIEHADCFEIEFEAETVKEAAVITRAGMNCKKDLRWFRAHAYSTGKVSLNLMIGQHHRADATIPTR